MSVFGTILSKLFEHGGAKPPAAASTPAAPPTPTPTEAPVGGAPASPPPDATADAGTAPAAPSQDTSSPADAVPSATVDVAAILDGLAEKANEKLDWKHSIVDMLKLLDMDSSLANRKALAQELHYAGDTNDSASMNIWLHGQVMKKLAENGGKVPAELVKG